MILPQKITFILCSCLIGSAAFGASAISDAQKKEIVYKMYAEYKKGFPGVTDISPAEAMEIMKKGQVVFVDTRKPAEMKVSMLPNAISKSEFLISINEYKTKTIIGYCTISYRSGKFAEELEQKGVQIFNLQGGILAWLLEGGKVYDSSGETKRVHVYGAKWNYLPDGYQPVMFGFFDKLF